MQKHIRAIWGLMAGHRRTYALAILALVLASAVQYLVPMVPRVVVDGIFAEGEAAEDDLVALGVELLGGETFLADNLWLPAVVMILLSSLAGGLTYLRGRWSALATERVVRRVRDRAYDHLQRLPCAYFDRAETGDLIQRCTSDVDTLRLFLSTQIVEIGRALVMLAAPLPFMAMIDWRLTIASVLLLPIITAFSLLFFVRVKGAFKATDEAEGAMTATIQENLTGIRVVRAFNRQDFEREKFATRNGEHRRRDMRMYTLMAWFWSSSDLLCFGQQAIVVGFGAVLMSRGELSVGDFLFFLMAVPMFLWPVRHMGRTLTDLGKAVVALGRIEQILDTPEEPAPPAELPAAVRRPPLHGRVVFDRVCFAYEADAEAEPVLDDVSFEIPVGRTLALIGASGSGKSTIISLLLRMYDLDPARGGRILLDGHDLSTIERDHVRSNVAVVMQQPFLYSKPINENIRIARSAASEEEIVEATSIAAVHESILEFEQGYETIVGERGVTLSGGQRQRVALARALLQTPAVLVLDDALSAVDMETESRIIDALRQRRGVQTTIVIAHRLSTAVHADEIIVLRRGRIVEQGSHEELVAGGGVYRRLWDLQNGGEDAAREIAAAIEGGAS